MTGLAVRIRRGLEEIAEPGRAPAMEAYMKSAMPYLGVSSVPRRALCRALFAELAWESADAWQADVLDVWRGAEFREERYCALELTSVRAARPFQTMDALPLYEELIVTGAWWDFVDEIASNRLGPMLRAEPAEMKRAMLDWAHCENMWKRRSAILCQLGSKGATDTDFLFACIAPSLSSKEFFLRKAIGWALRQYARTEPLLVADYVARNSAELSSLSKREAMKHIGRAT